MLSLKTPIKNRKNRFLQLPPSMKEGEGEEREEGDHGDAGGSER